MATEMLLSHTSSALKENFPMPTVPLTAVLPNRQDPTLSPMILGLFLNMVVKPKHVGLQISISCGKCTLLFVLFHSEEWQLETLVMA
jgi:hypothetical protein